MTTSSMAAAGPMAGHDVLKVMRTSMSTAVSLAAEPMAGAGADHFLWREARRACHEGRVRAIVKVMVDASRAGPLDAVYLDLHGAMVTEHLDDGEGEILARVRKLIGRTSRWSRARPAANVTPTWSTRRRADRLPHLPHMNGDTGAAANISLYC